jgi:hypothetical protein
MERSLEDNELNMIWKETVQAYFEAGVLAWYLTARTGVNYKEASFRIVSDRIEIRRGHHQDSSQNLVLSL